MREEYTVTMDRGLVYRFIGAIEGVAFGIQDENIQNVLLDYVAAFEDAVNKAVNKEVNMPFEP